MTDHNSRHADVDELLNEIDSFGASLDSVDVGSLSEEECRSLGWHAWLRTTLLGHLGSDDNEYEEAREFLDQMTALLGSLSTRQLLAYTRTFQAAAAEFMWDGF